MITSAHVVAGTHDQFLYDGNRYPAAVVVIDPDLDIAVLRAPTFRAPPLPLASHEVERGASGAVVGFPGGYHPTVSGAAVRSVIEVTGSNIYGDRTVQDRKSVV